MKTPTAEKTGKPILDALINASESFAEPAQASPLPWRAIENYKGGIPLSIHSDENTCVARVDWLPDGTGRSGEKNQANAKLIVRSVNHAEKLAEALRDLRTRVVAERPDCLNTTKADVALAAYEKEAGQ